MLTRILMVYKEKIEELINGCGPWHPAVYESRYIMEFKARTENCFRPIDGLYQADIEDMVREYVEEVMCANGVKGCIRNVVISGSRCRGLERENSDLDVVVELECDEREDVLFDMLHEEEYKIGGVVVDINPITRENTGTMEEYMSGVEEYLGEKYRSEQEQYAEK